MQYRVIDIEVFNDAGDGRYAAIGFAAAELAEGDRTRVEGVVRLLKPDRERGSGHYLIKDLPETMGPRQPFVRREFSICCRRLTANSRSGGARSAVRNWSLRHQL